LEILRFNPAYSVVFPIELIDVDVRTEHDRDAYIVAQDDL
jgi:hypothetical protein